MSASSAVVSDLWARGYSALPYPRRVELDAGDVILDESWKVVLGGETDEAAAETLTAGLAEVFCSEPGRAKAPGAKCIALGVRPGTVAEDAPEGIARQGYRLEVGPDRVTVTGNAPPGLFYGVQTLLQLLRRAPDGRGLELPRGRIDDWPDRELRAIHYDTKHHQDRLESVKDMIVRAAGFKVNAVAWEIEDKFAYRKHAVIGAPGAFCTEELREITAHALRHHVQIIPIVQGPSHLAFVLKHQEFADLREDPLNNYMLCPSNEKSYELLFSMYDELIEATPGSEYFHVGTDEPYFLGDGVECGCRARREAVGVGGMMAEFIDRCAKYLVQKGRTVMCWGEWPMTAKDIPGLPPGIINAVFQNPEMGEAYRKRGIRELIYCPTQGGRLLFPEYFYGPGGGRKPVRRVELLHERVCHGPARAFDPLGVLIAAWDDCGLHLECFWLGWTLGAGWGWNPEAPGKEEAVAQFMRIFHGPEALRMTELYRALDTLARFWTNSWDRSPSRRGPSYKRQWHPRYDRTLALPHLPDPDTLDNKPFFKERYAELLARAEEAKEEARRLTELLAENLGRARRNRYALEVFLSITALIADLPELLETLAELEGILDSAREDVGNVQFGRAATRLEEAASRARSYVTGREETLARLAASWEKSRYRKGRSVEGREFVHIQDDTKSHPADWTPDLGYLVKPSRDLNLEGWADRLAEIAAEFRRRHPERKGWRPGEGFEEDG